MLWDRGLAMAGGLTAIVSPRQKSESPNEFPEVPSEVPIDGPIRACLPFGGVAEGTGAERGLRAIFWA